jgi:UDPglucose--hexose-1-phosphate uridylyltransferase
MTLQCYLCPCNHRANGVPNPQYTGTFLFENDYSTVRMDEGEYDTDTFKKGASSWFQLSLPG